MLLGLNNGATLIDIDEEEVVKLILIKAHENGTIDLRKIEEAFNIIKGVLAFGKR